MAENQAWRIDKDKAEASGAELAALMSQAIEAMRQTVEDLGGVLSENAASASAALKGLELKDLGRQAAGNLADAAGEARDRARDMSVARLDDLEKAVKRNPLAWVAAAAGIGLVIGLWRNRDART